MSLVVVAASTPPAGAARQPTGGAGGRGGGADLGAPASATPQLVLTPSTGAGNVPVLDPVTVTGRHVTLEAVTLLDAAGRPVPGEYDIGRGGWRSTAPLAYGTRYTLTASGTTSGTAAGGGSTGEQLTQTSSFTTVRPAYQTRPSLLANAGLALAERQTYGVGQPIVVRFDRGIPDKAAAERSLEVLSTPPVDGAWHWFSDQEVHWRPRKYWPSGTSVTVTTHVYGRNLGNGLYGQRDVSASFTIGPSKIAIADDATFHMLVYIDGQLVRDIPVAMGQHLSMRSSTGRWINMRTNSGVHVVLDHERVTRMTSASFGLTGANGYDELVYWTTQISYSGEYVHAAPWSVAQQGHSDASHGCVNVNTDNAIWFYNTFIPGDIVDIRNTGRQLEPTNGLGDWTLSWTDWISGSALPYVSPADARRLA